MEQIEGDCMQDRYAGDVGDYGKIGLLKCLQAHGFTIGVNWYRVLELDVEKKDGSFKHVIEKWHSIIYNNFYYRIVTLGRLSFRITYDGGKIYE